MGFDLFQSRRNYNEPCMWWSRDERRNATTSKVIEDNSDELIMQRAPSGTFMAKEVSPESIQDSIVASSFIFDKSIITIKTPDNIWGIKSKDLVLFKNERWIVVNVQKSIAKAQNTMFASDKNCSHYWYLELRK